MMGCEGLTRSVSERWRKGGGGIGKYGKMI